MSASVNHSCATAIIHFKGSCSSIRSRARIGNNFESKIETNVGVRLLRRKNGPVKVQSVAGGVEMNKAGARTGLGYGVRITGTGSSAPKHVLSNNDLEDLVSTNDEWIKTRTGISRRHIAGEGESLSGLAAEACEKAMEMAGATAEEIDLIVVCTSTPDDLFGSACMVQANIGAKNAVAFDLTAACSGFVVGLVNVTHMMRGGNFKKVLLIGGDILSRYVDWRDRSTCILFGDGCGAVLLETEEGDCNILGFDMNSDGSMHESLVASYHQNGNGIKPLSESHSSGLGCYDNISMTGSDIFKFAVRAVPQTVDISLNAAGLQREDIDWLVLHQANQRIIDSAANRLGVPPEQVVSNIAEYGNTSAASIPLALDQAVRSDQIKTGDVIALAGFGAGLTWASAICKWGKTE